MSLFSLQWVKPKVVFLLTVPKRFLCCSYLFVRWWIYMWRFFCCCFFFVVVVVVFSYFFLFFFFFFFVCVCFFFFLFVCFCFFLFVCFCLFSFFVFVVCFLLLFFFFFFFLLLLFCFCLFFFVFCFLYFLGGFPLFVPHLSFFWCLKKTMLHECCISWVSSLTVFDLINAHTPIGAQSSNSVLFRLQPSILFCLLLYRGIYVVGTHLNCFDLPMQFKCVPITYTL